MFFRSPLMCSCTNLKYEALAYCEIYRIKPGKENEVLVQSSIYFLSSSVPKISLFQPLNS